MNDSIVGRPIRCNKMTLTPKNGKNYAEVIFLGDIHWGSPQCDKDKFLAMLDYVKKHSIYVFLMGDLVEIATKESPGAGVYEQQGDADTQYEQMLEWLQPLARKNLIVALLRGNHEERAYKMCGVDISKSLARELDVPYLGDACWSKFKVGHQTYTIYALHGRSGCRFDGTALLYIERLAVSFAADLVACGHMHKCVSSNILYQKVVNGVVKEFKKFLLITGSFLKYDRGYGQTLGLPISKLGCPKVKFFSEYHDIHISW